MIVRQRMLLRYDLSAFALILILPAQLGGVGQVTSEQARFQASTWELVEDLRVGGADDGPQSFAEIRGIAVTRNGNVFVLDFKQKELRVFDAKGAFLKTAARRGRGPGELEFPNGIAVGADDIVRLSDPGNGRFSLYSSQGSFIEQIGIPITGYGDYWSGAIDSAGRILDLPVRVRTGGTDPRTNYPVTEDRIRRIRTDGRADTLPLPECAAAQPTVVYKLPSGNATSMTLPYAPIARTAVAFGGGIWCTPSGEYKLYFGRIGTPFQEVVRQAVTPVPVTEDERRRAMEALDQWARNLGGAKLASGDPNAIPRVRPVITQLFTDDHGRAWVQRADVPSVPTALDVFDQGGRLVANVRSRAPIGRLNIVSGDALYTVLTNEDDVPVVVRYRIKK